jgi:TolA-binding protein
MGFFNLLLVLFAATGGELEIGDRYFNEGDYQKALQVYTEAEYEDPGLGASAGFQGKLGRAHFYCQEYQAAAASFKNSFYWSTTNDGKADALIWLGRSLFAEKDWTAAGNYFSQVIKYQPRPPFEFLYFFGLTCYEEGKVSDAYNLFQNLYEQAGPEYDRDEFRYLLGLCMMKSRNYSGGQFYLEGVYPKPENDKSWFEDDAVYLLALCDYYLGEPEKVIDLVDRFGGQFDRELKRKMTLLVGTIYLEEKNYGRALQTFNQILADSADGLVDQAAFRTGYGYFEMGDFQKAVEYFDGFLTANAEPEIVKRAFFYSGESYYELRQPAKAAERYQALLTRYPGADNRGEVQFRLADAYRQAGEFVKAQTEFRNFLTLFPASNRRTEANYWLAQSLDNIGREEEALEYLKKVEADSLSEYLLDAYYLAGSILLNLKRFREARENFALVGEGPLRPRALKGVGDALFAEAEWQKAINAYRQALALKPDERIADDIRYQIEFSYLKSGVYGSELDVFRNFVRKYPYSAKAPGLQFELGVQLYQQRHYEQALAEFERLLNNYPGHELGADGLELMGKSYIKLNQIEAAIGAYSRVEAQHKNSPVAPRVLEELGRLYAGQERFADALHVYSQLVQEYPNKDNVGPVLLEIGKLYRRLEKWREAKAVLQRFINQYPKSELLREAYLELVRVYKGESNWRFAERTVNDFLEKFGPAGDGYWEWAEIERSQGKYLQAKELFIRASELYGANRDRSAQALFEAGVCALQAGQTAEAKELFVRVDILAFDERLRIEAKRRILGLER